MMNQEKLLEMIKEAGILDNADQFYETLERLGDCIAYEDWLAIEHAANYRVACAIDAAFLAGMVAGARQERKR